jgi:3-phenylpropionate/cinnamic acid dioxygenase small subunit
MLHQLFFQYAARLYIKASIDCLVRHLVRTVDTAYRQISSLIAQYARAVDQADFPALGKLFENGKVTTKGNPRTLTGSSDIADYWKFVNRSYGAGGLLTHHAITNLDFGEQSNDTIVVKSYFTVFQSTPKPPLTPIVAGRYVDTFILKNEKWTFGHKHIEVTFVGDVSHHLNIELT